MRDVQGGGRQYSRPRGGARVLDVRHDRERAARQHVDALETWLLSGWIDGWRHGSRRRRDGADGARVGHRGIDSDSGELLRGRRPEAVARPRVARADAGRKRLRPRAELRADQIGARRRGDARLRLGAAGRRSVPDPAAFAAVRGAAAGASIAAPHRLVHQALDGRRGRWGGRARGRADGDGARRHGPRRARGKPRVRRPRDDAPHDRGVVLRVRFCGSPAIRSAADTPSAPTRSSPSSSRFTSTRNR